MAVQKVIVCGTAVRLLDDEIKWNIMRRMERYNKLYGQHNLQDMYEKIA